jgi:hypothetical protein
MVEQAGQVWTQNDLPSELTWIKDLSPLNQRLFFAEFQSMWGRYCATHDEGALEEFLEDWKATAEVDHDPELSAYLLAPRDESEFEEWKPTA